MKLSKDQIFSLLKNPKLWKTENVNANCPWCNHREFYVSLKDNHLWQCFRKKHCGEQGNIFKLLEKLGRFDLYNIKEDIKWHSMLHNSLEKENIELDLDIPEKKLPIGFKRVFNDEYLLTRGFNQDDFNHYLIGTTKLDVKFLNYVIFVIFQDHKIVGHIGRYKGTKSEIEAIEKRTGKTLLRYRNSDSDFSKILLGYDGLVKDETKTVIIVEGLFDKKNIDDKLNLKVNKELKCCATFKCAVSDEQILRLQNKGIENLIILYDPDVINSIRDQAMNLTSYFNVKIGYIESVNERNEQKDPAELTYEEVITTLNKLYLPLDFYTKKVQVINLR